MCSMVLRCPVMRPLPAITVWCRLEFCLHGFVSWSPSSLGHYDWAGYPQSWQQLLCSAVTDRHWLNEQRISLHTPAGHPVSSVWCKKACVSTDSVLPLLWLLHQRRSLVWNRPNLLVLLLSPSSLDRIHRMKVTPKSMLGTRSLQWICIKQTWAK